MKKFPIYLFVILFSSISWSVEKVSPSNVETRILEKIVKNDPICTHCNLIVQKTESPWLKNHDFYEVVTFDILPPPAWHFAVKGSEILFMDRRNLEDWNKVITDEKMKLDSDTKIIDYVKFFLSTTMNQSEFIEKLSQSEINRIEAKEKKKIDAEMKISQTDNKIQVLFYANDTQGELQQWNMVVRNNGEILKLQERSF